MRRTYPLLESALLDIKRIRWLDIETRSLRTNAESVAVVEHEEQESRCGGRRRRCR